MTTDTTPPFVPPRAATLHLGGNAYAHPDLAPLVRSLTEHKIQRSPGNPRRGDHEAIVDSIRSNGVYSPVKVQRSTGYVLAGNHTYDAVTDQGATSLPWVWLDVDDDEARRIMLADNRTAELGGYDDQLLLEAVRAAAVADALLAGTGYTPDDLAELIRAAEAAQVPLNDPDDAPPPPPDDYVPISAPGDVWQLGRHRLVCGDSTKADTFAALLGTDRAACVWTDPPYGVEYVARSEKALSIENDDLAGLRALLTDALTLARDTCTPGAAWYVAYADRNADTFLNVLVNLGVYRLNLIWVKNALVLGRGDYHARHEPIAYGWTPAQRRLHPVAARDQDTVWEISKPHRSVDHPTMKPVELVARALRNSTKPGDLVLDPFGGSGTTLIACEQEDRTARLIELDPRYADVICRRYQQHTGTLPTRNGEPVDFTT